MMVTRWEMQPDMVADNSTGTVPSGTGPMHDMGSDPGAGEDTDLTPTAQMLHAKYQQYLLTQQQQRREKLERERQQANNAGVDLDINLSGLGSYPLFGSSHESYTPSREIHVDQHRHNNNHHDHSSPLMVHTHAAHPIFPWGIGVGASRSHSSSMVTKGGAEPSLSELSLPQTRQHHSDQTLDSTDHNPLVMFDDTPYQQTPPMSGGIQSLHSTGSKDRSNHSTGSRDRDRDRPGSGGNHHHPIGNHNRNVEMEMGNVSGVVAAVAAAIGNIDQNMADLADMDGEDDMDGEMVGVTWRDTNTSTSTIMKGTTNGHGMMIGSGGGLLLNRGLSSNHTSNHTMGSFSRNSLASSGSLNSGNYRSHGGGMGLSLGTHHKSPSPDYIEKETNKVIFLCIFDTHGSIFSS